MLIRDVISHARLKKDKLLALNEISPVMKNKTLKWSLNGLAVAIIIFFVFFARSRAGEAQMQIDACNEEIESLKAQLSDCQ